LFPLLPIETVGLIIQFILLVFANIGGVGGGGVIIAFVILFNNFDAKQVAQ
jgi:hypothetical protein